MHKVILTERSKHLQNFKNIIAHDPSTATISSRRKPRIHLYQYFLDEIFSANWFTSNQKLKVVDSVAKMERDCTFQSSPLRRIFKDLIKCNSIMIVI